MPARNSRLWAYSLPATLALLAPFNLLASLGMDIYLPAVPAMPDILGTTPEIVQLTLTLYMITLGAGQILFGPLSDRIGRRPILIAGALVFAAASFLLAFMTTAWLFILLRWIQAMGAAAMLVAMFATVRDIYANTEESASIYSVMNAMLAVVPALGPVAGALIARFWGWSALFLALGSLTLLALGYAFPRWHESRKPSRELRKADVWRVFKNAHFWVYTVAFGTAMGTFFVFFSTAPRILIERAGFSELGFSLAFSTVAFVMIVTTRFAKRCVTRWGIPGCAVRGLLILLVSSILLWVGEVFFDPGVTVFLASMWLAAVGIVLITAVTANGALYAFDDMAGTAVALHFCVQSLIVGGISTAAVVLLDGSTSWPLIVYTSGMAGLTLWLLAVFVRVR